MKPDAVERAERVLDREAETWARIVSGGYSLNEHWTVGFFDGSRAFLKEASVEPSPQWLRDEQHVYACVRGPFMPELLGFEDGDKPLLILEDMLAEGRWPPPWQAGDVEAVLAALRQVAAAPVGGELPRLVDDDWAGWQEIARDPEPFLRTGVASAAWLAGALPRLLEAEVRTPLAGDSLVHCDVRSDNLCFRDGRVVLLDWNHARIGNPASDVAFWLPSLVLEHGPPPDEFGVDDFAAVVAGFFAARAGLPPPEGAPRVRGFQREQLEVALPWACRVLGLPLG
jgi:hypothetical protein